MTEKIKERRVSTVQDFNWISRCYSELSKQYSSQYVAVKNGRVIASGRDIGKVYNAAVRRVKKHFVTGYILSAYQLPSLSHSKSPNLSLREKSPKTVESCLAEGN